MDLLPILIEESAKRKRSIYFYGSTVEVLDNIKKRINFDHPSLGIKMYSPPFRLLTEKEDQDVIKEINCFNPDFVFVALGCPKQEKWMAQHKGKINSCMIGLGGAFPVYAGLQNRAPKWMSNNSLEWLYRFFLEPKRLLRRYFVTNFLFIYYICIDFIIDKKNK
jgi:N-acetylglucosaminyldiphosphoundecaprenol N-acetyl-beta-D-mannosaminyltransferase